MTTSNDTRKSAPTLDDVAKAAGVSTATVSRCLNAPDRVVEKTRKRVMEAVEKLGYAPNFAAQVMAAKRSFTIGAIIPTMDNAIFARGLQAFQNELREAGYTLLVSSSAYDPDIEKEQIRTLVSRGADGLLLIGQTRDDAIYEFLETRNMPTLAAWSHVEQARLPSVGFDNKSAMAKLTAYVIGLGHRNIAMMSGVTHGNDRASARVDGFWQAVDASGLDHSAIQVTEAPYGIDTGARAFEHLWASAKQPTAIICGNDVLAAGALRAAQSAGVSVPEDVSITGFDDIELATIVTPSLTTVHVPHLDMGCKAAEELIAMVEGTSDGTSTKLDTRIEIRASLAPPR